MTSHTTFAVFQDATTKRYKVCKLSGGINCGPVGPTYLKFSDAMSRCRLECAKADCLCPEAE